MVDLGEASASPIGAGMPESIVLELADVPRLEAICGLMIGEAFGAADGRVAALDRLFEYLLIMLIREVMARGLVDAGVLTGLADPRLGRALTAMHDEPRREWTSQGLADAAGMSRTRFAARFRAVVGATPIDYLASWRMATARRLLREGRPLKAVARQVGYDNAAAFTRRFAQLVGHPQRQWLAIQHGEDAPANRPRDETPTPAAIANVSQ